MKHYYLNRNNYSYYYIEDEELHQNKKWKYISFLDEIELDSDEFTSLVGMGGMLDLDDEKPARNETVSKKTCYIEDEYLDNLITRLLRSQVLVEVTNTEFECFKAMNQDNRQFKSFQDFLNWCDDKKIPDFTEALEFFINCGWEVPTPEEDEE